MIATISTALLFATIKQVQPVRPILLVLAQHEQAIDVAQISPNNCSVETLRAKLGIATHFYKGETSDVYISENVAPLNAYSQMGQTLAELNESGSLKIKHGSEAGKTFRKIFDGTSLRKATSAKPDDECFGLFINIGFQMKTPKQAPISTLHGPGFSEFDRPQLTKYSHEELLEIGNKHTKPLNESIFRFGKQEYQIRQLERQTLTQESAILAYRDATIALESSSATLFELFLKYRQNYSVLLNSLKDRFASELVKFPNEGAAFNKLPLDFQKRLRSDMESSFEAYGFKSPEEGMAFLDSNPQVKLDFSLAAFEASQSQNAQTGKSTNGNMFVILRNPANP